MKIFFSLLLFACVVAKAQKTPSTNATCSGLGVENGWGAWKAATGDNSNGTITFNATNLTPTAPRFNLTSGNGIDACTPGLNPGDPTIPVIAPGLGNASIQLGQIQCSGICGGCNLGCVEQLTYPLTVTTQDTDFTFAYAIVMEDPGHTPANQPYVSFCISDQAGNPIPCGCFRFTANPSLPGFYTSSCNVNSVSYYKPWTTVGVSLAPYVGQVVLITIINADCAQGGHFAQSYWDFSCGTIQPEFCTGQQLTLCASDSSTGVTYQWSTGATTKCIVVTPQQADTFSVAVFQPSGCNFTLRYTPQDTCLNPNGVNEISNSSINIFPNPSSGNLFIDFGNKNFGKAEIVFSDVIGRILYETSIPASGKQALDVSEFSKGIYFLKLKTDHGIATKKIVIAK